MLKQNIMPLLLYAAYLSVFISFKVVSASEDAAAGLHSNRQSIAKSNSLNLTNVIEHETNVIIMQNQTNLNNSKESISKDDANGTAIININHRFKFLSQLFDNFDRYTLIMISAFVMGILLIGILIAISFCICKSCTRIKQKNPSNITTNPMYRDTSSLESLETIGKQGHNNSHSKSFKHDDHEIRSLLNISNNREEDGEDEKPNAFSSKTIQSIDSTLTSSNLSINSIAKSPNKLNSTNETSGGLNKTAIKNSLTSLSEKMKTKENQEKIKLINDNEEVDVRIHNESISFQARYTPSSSTKTKQQMQREHRPSLSRNSLCLRSTSESVDSKETNQIADENGVSLSKASKRSSIASSISSIFNRQSTHSKLNFDLVDDEIDKLAGTVKVPSTSKPNLNDSQTSVNLDGSKKFLNSSNSINNSFSDIYMKAINEKREENKKKATLNSKNTTTTTPDGKTKRHSINNISSKINTNPSGVNSNSKRDLNDNESIYTYESEKSCY